MYSVEKHSVGEVQSLHMEGIRESLVLVGLHVLQLQSGIQTTAKRNRVHLKGMEVFLRTLMLNIAKTRGLKRVTKYICRH